MICGRHRVLKRISSLISVFLLFLPAKPAAGQISVHPSAGKTPEQIVKEVILGNGVTITNVTFNGKSGVLSPEKAIQFGTFSNAAPGSYGFFSSGIILCTGDCKAAVGPNNDSGWTSSPKVIHTFHCAELSKIVFPYPVNSPAVLEFDFSSVTSHVAFRYIFASEEYPEYSCSAFNDVFGFFVTDPKPGKSRNIALIPGTQKAVSVNNIHPEYNDCKAVHEELLTMLPIRSPFTQFDGFVGPLTAEVDLEPGQTYHMKLAIANVSDHSLESAVFLEAQSFNAIDDLGFVVKGNGEEEGNGEPGIPPQTDTLSERHTEGIRAKDLTNGGDTQKISLIALKDGSVINPDDYIITTETDFDPLLDEVSAKIEDGAIHVFIRAKSQFCNCFLPDEIPVNVVLTPQKDTDAQGTALKRIVQPVIVPILEREPWLGRCLWVIITLAGLLLFLVYLRALSKKNRFHKHARIKNSYVVEDQLKETVRSGKHLRKPGFFAWLNRWFIPFTDEKCTFRFSRPKTDAITFVATASKNRIGVARSSYNPRTMTIPNHSAATDRDSTGKPVKWIPFPSGTAIEIKKTDAHGTTRLGHLHYVVQGKDDERLYRIVLLLLSLAAFAAIILLIILLVRGL